MMCVIIASRGKEHGCRFTMCHASLKWHFYYTQRVLLKQLLQALYVYMMDIMTIGYQDIPDLLYSLDRLDTLDTHARGHGMN